jgi:hypothetical protein
MNRSVHLRKRRPTPLPAGRRGPGRYSLQSVPMLAAFDIEGSGGEDERAPEHVADDLDHLFNEGTDFDADEVEWVADVRRIHCNG